MTQGCKISQTKDADGKLWNFQNTHVSYIMVKECCNEQTLTIAPWWEWQELSMFNSGRQNHAHGCSGWTQRLMGLFHTWPWYLFLFVSRALGHFLAIAGQCRFTVAAANSSCFYEPMNCANAAPNDRWQVVAGCFPKRHRPAKCLQIGWKMSDLPCHFCAYFNYTVIPDCSLVDFRPPHWIISF